MSSIQSLYYNESDKHGLHDSKKNHDIIFLKTYSNLKNYCSRNNTINIKHNFLNVFSSVTYKVTLPPKWRCLHNLRFQFLNLQFAFGRQMILGITPRIP